jgi:hypothetical protein
VEQVGLGCTLVVGQTQPPFEHATVVGLWHMSAGQLLAAVQVRPPAGAVVVALAVAGGMQSVDVVPLITVDVWMGAPCMELSLQVQ